MTVSFYQAREAVGIVLSSQYGEGHFIPEWGWENSLWWSIPYGDRRYLIDGNPHYQEVGPPAYFVNKLTGEVRAGSHAINPEFFFSEELDGMEPYGNVPSHFLDDESEE
jgi:hypothetical protein